MKLGVLFACCLPFIATPALGAIDANQCYANSTKMKRTERSAYLASCMAKVSSDANIDEVRRKNKSAACEQNAKNRHLQGNARSAYVSKCMTADEAAAASAKLASSPKTTLPWLAAEKTETKKQTSRHRSKKSCDQRAAKLKGEERKRHMKRCKQK